MARKEVVTKNDLLRCAFDLARSEGFEEVTARKLAAKAGCSTQPIFRVYKNMDELLQEVMSHAIAFFEQYYTNYPKAEEDLPFVNLGLAYIGFATNEKHLFQMMFLSSKRGEHSLYELLNGRSGNLLREITKAKEQGCLDPEGLFMKMWIFIHGAASMAITGDYDLSERETEELLKKTYRAFMA
ncbi:MAG: TetR/AcrR family transcriptional regulator [Lachnospiraceae bacterium]|nr:TetR/AcrR family transcriptional regulator [Lachnospiraceae bacterium]